MIPLRAPVALLLVTNVPAPAATVVARTRGGYVVEYPDGQRQPIPEGYLRALGDGAEWETTKQP